jgi:precorrin-3B synthase
MQTGDGLLVRLNPVAGGLPPQILIGLCESASRHGNGILEVTQRGSIQIRGLTPDSARLLADDVNALGIAVRTGVPVETSPLAGLDPDEIADPRPLAGAIRSAVERAGLSRRLGPKVSVIVDGGGRIGMGDLLADVRLAANQVYGETLWHIAIGGTAETALPAGLVAEAEACEATVTTLEAIAELGRAGRGRDLNTKQLESSRSFAPPSVLPDISPTRGEISRSVARRLSAEGTSRVGSL